METEHHEILSRGYPCPYHNQITLKQEALMQHGIFPVNALLLVLAHKRLSQLVIAILLFITNVFLINATRFPSIFVNRIEN